MGGHRANPRIRIRQRGTQKGWQRAINFTSDSLHININEDIPNAHTDINIETGAGYTLENIGWQMETMLVYYTNGLYYAKLGSTGEIYSVNSDLTPVLQAALDYRACNLIYLKLKGEHTLTSKLTITNRNTRLAGTHTGSTAADTTVLVLADGVNDDILSITTDFVTVKNITLDGNSAGQVGNHDGLTQVGGGFHGTFNYVFVRDCGDYGFVLVGANNQIFNCTAKACGIGWLFSGCVEFTFCRELKASQNTKNIIISNSPDMKIFGLVSNQATEAGLYIQNGSDNVTIYGSKIENNGYWGVVFSGVENCVMIGGSIRNNSQTTTNTYANAFFTTYSGDYSLHNKLVDLNIYSDTAKVAKYNVDEADANQDFNTITNCYLYGAGTKQANIQGVNSGSREEYIRVMIPDDLTLGNHHAKLLPDNADTREFCEFLAPFDYQEIISIEARIVAAATGNLRRNCYSYHGESGVEAYNANTTSSVAATIGMTANRIEMIDLNPAALFSGVQANDLVGLQFQRDGANGLDTIDDDCYYLGMRVRWV